jgi:hypothetical protein
MWEWKYNSTSPKLGTRQKSLVSFTRLGRFTNKKKFQYLLDRRLVGPHSLSGRCGLEKIDRPDRIHSLNWRAIPARNVIKVVSIYLSDSISHLEKYIK